MDQSGEGLEAAVVGAVDSPSGTAPPQVPARAVVEATLRVVLFVWVLLLVYAVIPMNQSAASTTAVIVLCAVGLAVFAVVFIRRLRAITRSPYPLVTGAEALVEVLAVFVVLFALIHLAIADASPLAYTEHIDRIDAIYFAVTVLTTVGFGDISPVSSGARIATTIQMIADLFLIAAAARVIIGVARRSDAKHRNAAPSDPPA